VRSILALVACLLSLPAAAAEGCWVRFFEEENFARPLQRLAGALYINSIAGPGLIGRMNEEDFFRRARSLVVGPEARLFAYAERGFGKELFTLQPGAKVKDLREIGFPARVASLKVLCQRPASPLR
jgi:hypothetical protein